MAEPEKQPIKADPTGHGLGGWVFIDRTLDSAAVFDVALTPCVIIAPGEPPRITEWVVSRRTMLDVRPRMDDWPFRHIGIRPPDLSSEDWRAIRDMVAEAAKTRRENHQQSDWLEGMVKKIEAALRTEEGG